VAEVHELPDRCVGELLDDSVMENALDAELAGEA
jgi:hypothetical protein